MNLSTATANALAEAFGAVLDGGSVEIYSGTQPATANTALSGNTLLATVTLQATAFGAAVDGVITLAAPAQVTAVADGTATWARWKTSGAAAVMDTSIGTDLTINDPAIVTDNSVEITSFTYTQPKAAA